MDFTIDNNGKPVLAVCEGEATAEERNNWVRQIPMIYRDRAAGFVLIYRTPVGGAAIQPLGGTNQAEAVTKARVFLAPPERAVLNTYDQDWANYNQRESDNLMNIVAVVYGVALTAALINRPDLLLSPVTVQHRISSLALLVAALLTSLTFYGYVLAIGGDKPYNVTWTLQSSKPWGIVRFFVDLILASLYVHLLFVAVHVTAGPNTAPRLAGFVFAFIPVFAGALVVRVVRGRWLHPANLVAIVGGVVAFLLWIWTRHQGATRGFDLLLEVLLLGLVLVYGALNHVVTYCAWRNDPSATAPPKP